MTVRPVKYPPMGKPRNHAEEIANAGAEHDRQLAEAMTQQAKTAVSNMQADPGFGDDE